mgnify:FL=1
MSAVALATYNEAERKVIQNAYRRLLRQVKIKTIEERRMIRKAFEMSTRAHSEQRRKSGEPYILHPIEVARIAVAEMGLGPVAVVSALLHDVVEDTPITVGEIREVFGEKIAMIVEALTKFERLYDVQSPQAETFKKILVSLAQDVRVVMVKMADRLHNMRTLGSMPPHKQMKIASETAYIYAPLAHRLGLYKVKTELEDLCMKITESERYNEIELKLKETEKVRARYVTEFMRPIRKSIENLNVKFRISGRTKSVFSISNKMKKKQIPFEEIYDLFAVRIIVDLPKENEKSICWQIYSIISDAYNPIPERLKDWVSTPKSNGYESLHTTVVGPKGRFVEVQIRSERMDEVAEKGLAAHWKYKGVSSSDGVFDRWLNHVREMLASPEEDALDFLNDFRTNLFSKEVYVFTPKGEMRMLPKGATALDFAFDIHTEVGSKCMGVQVNGRQVPISYVLKNGDRMRVVTSKTQKPSESWLKVVVTGKAKSRIRQSLKEERKQQGEIGKEYLLRKLKNIKVELTYENLEVLLKFYGVQSSIDLYFGIAMEELSLNRLKELEVEHGKLSIKKEEKQPVLRAPSTKKTSVDAKPRLTINGEDASLYAHSLAACCKPVQGDEIFAYTTTHDGVKIHRNACPNAENMLSKYGYRVMRAAWVTSFNTSFVADLELIGVDDVGIIQRLTNILTNVLQVNMRSFSMDGDEGYFKGKISVVVNNTDQLNFIIKSLRDQDYVSSVVRIED